MMEAQPIDNKEGLSGALIKNKNDSNADHLEIDHKKAENFWSGMYSNFPDAEGALLGNIEVDKPDIQFQTLFLTDCSLFLNGYNKCLELAAGPLRVTLGMLSYFFKEIDVNDIANLSQIWMKLEPEFSDGKFGKRKRKGVLG